MTLLKYADTQVVYTDEKDRKLARALEQENIRYEVYPQHIAERTAYDIERMKMDILCSLPQEHPAEQRCSCAF